MLIFVGTDFQLRQDVWSDVHSTCREENGHEVDIYVHATGQAGENMKMASYYF